MRPNPSIERRLEVEKEKVVAPANSKPRSHASAADSAKAVEEFMLALEHRFKVEIQAIRSLILGADPSIGEGIKWNAPSFRTTEYFATTNLREKNGVGVILHLGAKVRDATPDGMPIDDPEKLLTWLARDRATMVFKGMDDLNAKKAAFVGIIRSWIAYV
jgi:hypothetical protein